MTFNERQLRSPHSRVKQVLDRLQQEAGAGKRAITPYATICDMISIPYDLRASLLEQLVREGHVTREGDRVRLIEAGKALAASSPDCSPASRTPA